MKKPNLFIVWAPKCGTTSMHYYLSQHPEIFMSEVKEPQFFCSDLHKESDTDGNWTYAKDFRNINQYLQLFNNVKGEKIVWEASSNYLSSLESAKNIYNFNKDSKIVIMLREPIDLLYSLHSELIRNKDEKQKNFIKALEFSEKLKTWIKLNKNTQYRSRLYYFNWIKFYKQITRFISYFKNENIKVIFLDDLSNTPEKVYYELLLFLWINDINFKPDFLPKNIHSKILFPNIKKIIKNPFIWNIPKMILPTNVYNNIRDFLLSLFVSYKKRKKLDKNIKIELMKKNKNEVIKLNKLLHENNLISKEKDLIKLWWYDKI